VRRLLVLSLLALLLLPGCDKKVRCEIPQDCSDQDESGLDRVWACDEDGLCQPFECETSTDCAIQTFCADVPIADEDEEPKRHCAWGCARTEDCLAGEVCIEAECRERPCRSGHLDCELGEFCNSSNGQCEPAGFPFCEPCDSLQNSLLNAGSCEEVVVLGHPLCGQGNFCWSLAGGTTCGVACEDNSDCPGGFTCGMALRSSDLCGSGFQILGKYCASDLCF
jgi:hypothetical protein